MRQLFLKSLLTLGLLPGLALGAASKVPDPLPSPVKMRLCLFDIMGANGDIANMARDLILEARKSNLIIELKVYTDERVVAEDFKAGQCDAAGMSTLRAKQFNKVIGSIDSPGNLLDYGQMKTLLYTLANPQLSQFGITGRYQVAAVLPIGAIFVMVNDRNINSIEKAAGKRVAVLDWDKSQSQMISSIGAQPVPSDITSYGGKFNNGQADIIAAPTMAYKPLELYKGLGKKGGVFRFPLLQASGTLLIRRDFMLAKIPDLDARLQQLREFGLTKLDPIFETLRKSEKEIPDNYWMDLSPDDKLRYTRMLREARLKMTKDGVYDPTMMNLLKRVRCKHDPANAECSSHEE